MQNVYVPDVCAVAGFYPDWFGYGAGVTNYLSVPDLPLDEKSTKYDLPGGFIPNGDLSKFQPITGQKDPYWRKAVTEDSDARLVQGRRPAASVERARPIPSSPTGRKTASTPGSRRRASKGSPRRSARWRTCWPATPPAIR